MARLTDRLSMLASARFSALMEQRRAAEKPTVSAAVTRAVVWALVQHADTEGVSYPSIETLATESDSSPRTAKRVIAILRDEGIVVIRRRNHGAAAGRKLGQSMEGCTNVYRINWARFAELSTLESVNEYAGTGASVAREQGPAWPVNRGQPVTEHGPACPETGASLAPKLSSEPSSEPPPAPSGGEAGGGGESNRDAAEQRSTPSTDRQWAADSRPRYPFHANALPVGDEDSLVDAYAAERTRHEGATPAEIATAIDAFALRCSRGEILKPLALRVWVKQRGYWPFVVQARQAAAAAASRDAVVVAGRIGSEAGIRAEAERAAAKRAADAAELAALSDAEYATLVAEVRASMPAFAGRGLDGRGPLMRSMAADLLRKRRASVGEVVEC